VDDRFVFDGKELHVGELRFQLVDASNAWDDWKRAPDDRFLMYKPRRLLEMFDEFFSSRTSGRHLGNIFEIGIFDGGSTAFWFEYFEPEKLVAVDWLKRGDSKYFSHYLHRRGIDDRLRTFWEVDQQDAERLREIVSTEFSGKLDLVIDDGSHLLEPTKTSFETLFPLLREGGLYMIEDWNWELVPACRAPDHPFATRDGLVGLVADLCRVTGSSHTIRSITVYHGFVAVERGSKPEDPTFNLQDYLSSLPVKLDTGSGPRR
jgi:Methyltransferase domain